MREGSVPECHRIVEVSDEAVGEIQYQREEFRTRRIGRREFQKYLLSAGIGGLALALNPRDAEAGFFSKLAEAAWSLGKQVLVGVAVNKLTEALSNAKETRTYSPRNRSVHENSYPSKLLDYYSEPIWSKNYQTHYSVDGLARTSFDRTWQSWLEPEALQFTSPAQMRVFDNRVVLPHSYRQKYGSGHFDKYYFEEALKTNAALGGATLQVVYSRSHYDEQRRSYRTFSVVDPIKKAAGILVGQLREQRQDSSWLTPGYYGDTGFES